MDIKDRQISKLSKLQTSQELTPVLHTLPNSGSSPWKVWTSHCFKGMRAGRGCGGQAGSLGQRVNGSTWGEHEAGGAREGRGQGASGERRVICIKMGVPLPRRAALTSMDVNRGLVTSTKLRLFICHFLLRPGFLP